MTCTQSVIYYSYNFVFGGKTVIVGYVLNRRKEFENNRKGIQKAWRCLKAEKVAKHRPSRVSGTLSKRRWGKEPGKGRWTKNEHIDFCNACNRLGIQQFRGGTTEKWTFVQKINLSSNVRVPVQVCQKFKLLQLPRTMLVSNLPMHINFKN